MSTLCAGKSSGAGGQMPQSERAVRDAVTGTGQIQGSGLKDRPVGPRPAVQSQPDPADQWGRPVR